MDLTQAGRTAVSEAPAWAPFEDRSALFVMGRSTRLEDLRAVVQRSGSYEHIDHAEGVVDALSRIARQPVALLVLDFAVDAGIGPALIWHQLRTAPDSLILVFDDAADFSGEGAYRVWSWKDAPLVLKCALEQRQRLEPRASRSRR